MEGKKSFFSLEKKEYLLWNLGRHTYRFFNEANTKKSLFIKHKYSYAPNLPIKFPNKMHDVFWKYQFLLKFSMNKAFYFQSSYISI